MQTVLITGINGFVAQNLAEALLENGYKVVGMGRGHSRVEFSHSNFIYESVDFTNKDKVDTALKQYKPDVVVHSGAVSKPDECELDQPTAYNINVGGTKNLLKAAVVHQSFFIYLSTDFVFSGNEGFYKEDDEHSPVNYYGQTKLLGEEEVKLYPHEWSIVRTILVYGKPRGGKGNIMTMVADSLSAKKTLRMFEDQERTPTYVEDLVNGIVKIIERKATGIYHISGEDKITIHDIAIAVAEHLGLDRTLISPATEHSFQQPARRPPKTAFDLRKAKTILSYQPTSFSDGLKKTFS